MSDERQVTIIEVFNIPSLGKVIAYVDFPDDEPVIKVGDTISIANDDLHESAMVNGIELIKYKDPRDHKLGKGGLLIEWISNPMSDESLKGAQFSRIEE